VKRPEPDHLHRRLLVALALVMCAGSGAALLVADRSTVERGNLLFRSGDAAGAVEVYRDRVAGSEAPDRVAYNLGTALLRQQHTEAESHLLAGATSEDPEIAGRSEYNLAVGLLADVRFAPTPDSAAAILTEAVRRSSEAIRRMPGFGDAVWNLAIAQHMLDSLGIRPLDPDYEVSPGDDNTLIDLDALVQSETGDGASGMEPETPSPTQATGERQAALQGAREAWTTQDPGPLAPEAARAVLGNVVDDPEQLIRGILWSLRPDIAWWTGERYPGGDW